MSDDRRYTEAELHAIFERAAKRQEEARRAEAASQGELTLAELQEIGAASGIDPAHVAVAAAELGAGPPRKAHAFLGAPMEVERSRVLPCAVTDDAWAQIVAEVRQALGADGSVGQLGRTREWTAVGRGIRRDVTMRLAVEPVDGGRSRVTVRQSVHEQAQGLGVAAAINGAVGLVFLTLAVLGVDAAFWGVGALLTSFALAFAGITRGWLEYWVPKQKERFAALLDRIDRIARDEAPAAPPADAVAEPVGGGRIDLDALPDPAEDPAPTTRSRTRT